jgi:AcrR family transcriptional regulator
MSIQDVLEETGASRGAFYHYFPAKAALLEAVVERMTDTVVSTLTPLVEDASVAALPKLEGLFMGIARWKGERTDLMLALLQVWLSDENAIVREKFRRGTMTRLTPLLCVIIRQGCAEGVFSPSSADDAAHVLVSILQATNDAAVRLFFDRQHDQVPLEAVKRMLDAYVEAMERILGLPARSLTMIDDDTLKRWYA